MVAASMARTAAPTALVGTTHFVQGARIMKLMEEKPELSAEDVRFLKHYDQCQSCLVSCDFYEVGP